VTHQTGPEGKKVNRLLIEEGADIKKELYVSLVVDRVSQKVALMASSEGGMDIEEVAAHTPEKIHTLIIDPSEGLKRTLTTSPARSACPTPAFPRLARPCKACTRLLGHRRFAGRNQPADPDRRRQGHRPGRQVQLRLQRAVPSPGNRRLPRLDEEDANEIEASKFDLAYISLDGNIGCLVNGAGLAMATMDTIKLFGGEPANFLDVGGGATREGDRSLQDHAEEPEREGHPGQHLRRHHALRRDRRRRDHRFEGRAAGVPLVVRMKGTNEELGKKMLADSGLPIISADTMEEAAQKVVAAVAGK
jgi:succinyl-CoA synthetase beta subunit